MIKYNLSFFLLLFINLSNSQTEIKFNLASGVLLVPNIGIEIQINESFGYQLDTSASFWDSIDGSPFQFTQIFNELRYYPKLKKEQKKRSFFIGSHIGYGMFTLRNPKILTSVIDSQSKPEGSYQSGRNTYYGLSFGKKVKLNNPRFGLEFFIGGGSSQSNYKYYNSDEELEYDDPIAKRDFSKSGEELVYRGGIMLVYKL